MSASVDVLATIRAAGVEFARQGDLPQHAAMLDARGAVADLIEAASEFTRGMPLQYATNARVVGNCNARQIENIRDALARCKGGAL